MAVMDCYASCCLRAVRRIVVSDRRLLCRLRPLPHKHRREDFWSEIMTRAESCCGCVFDGGNLGCVKGCASSGVEHFALDGIIDERLEMLRAILNDKPQAFPLCFIPLPVTHTVSFAPGPRGGQG